MKLILNLIITYFVSNKLRYFLSYAGDKFVNKKAKLYN